MLIGVVGKANVGKSTFFKAATLMDVIIANYPFATIKPNHGVGFVRIPCADKFFNVKCNPRVGYCIDHNRFVAIDLIDVAGLVPGAHEGKGMGLAFLDDLNQADALIHVIDVSGSTNDKGEPTEPNTRDPADDIRFLEDELDHWYLGMLKKVWVKFSRTVTQTQEDVAKALNKQFTGVGSNEDMVKEILAELKLAERRLDSWSEEDLFSFAKALRKRTKPMLIAANKIDVPGASENLKRLQKEFPELIIVPCSAESELALKQAAKQNLISYLPGDSEFSATENLDSRQSAALDFIKQRVLETIGSTGVQKCLNDSVFKLLDQIAVFPGGMSKLEDQHGNVLPDCFILPDGSTALDFAYKVHTDLGDNFIRAIDVKTKRTVGKEHILKNLDVVEIISGK